MERDLTVPILHEQKQAVAGCNVPVRPSRYNGIVRRRTSVSREMHRTRVVLGAQPVWIIGIGWVHPPVAANGIAFAKSARKRRTRSWRAVVQIKYLAIKLVRRGTGTKDVVDIGQRGGFECWARHNRLKTVREDHTYSLRINKEEQLILLNRPTQRPCPLVGDTSGAWISQRAQPVIDPVVGIQHGSVPVVLRIPMKGVAAGLG
jgi:hypothetical protein